METVLYRKADDDTECRALLNEVREKRAKEVEERRIQEHNQMLRKLGFSQVLDAAEPSAVDVALGDARVLFDELDGQRLKDWSAFLYTRRSARNYNFDRPPMAVLDAIAQASALQLFSSIEYWTPQRNTAHHRIEDKVMSVADKVNTKVANFDPMAVGVINTDDGNHYFPIARWGEALLSEDYVHKFAMHKRAKIVGLIAAMIAAWSVVIGGYFFIGAQLNGDVAGWWFFVVGIILAVAHIVGGVFIGTTASDRRRRNRYR